MAAVTKNRHFFNCPLPVGHNCERDPPKVEGPSLPGLV
jgi:hypothetical protein